MSADTSRRNLPANAASFTSDSPSLTPVVEQPRAKIDTNIPTNTVDPTTGTGTLPKGNLADDSV